MNAQRLDTLQREMLRERLGALAGRLRSEMEQSLRASGSEAAASSIERDTRVAEMERDADELERVGAALARVDNPLFGRCVDCGEAIAWARLLATPHAIRCRDCAAADERRAMSPHASL